MASTALSRRAFEDLERKLDRRSTDLRKLRTETTGASAKTRDVGAYSMGAFAAGAARELPIISDPKVQAGISLAAGAIAWWQDAPSAMQAAAGFGAPALADQGQAAARWLKSKASGDSSDTSGGES